MFEYFLVKVSIYEDAIDYFEGVLFGTKFVVSGAPVADSPGSFCTSIQQPFSRGFILAWNHCIWLLYELTVNDFSKINLLVLFLVIIFVNIHSCFVVFVFSNQWQIIKIA